MYRQKTVYLNNQSADRDTRSVIDQQWWVQSPGVVNNRWSVGQQRVGITLTVYDSALVEFTVDESAYLSVIYDYANDTWINQACTGNEIWSTQSPESLDVTSIRSA